MHDYFEILGVAPGARAQEIREACRRVRASHPDVHDGEPGGGQGRLDTTTLSSHEVGDVAVDFVEMAPIVGRMTADFFGTPR